MTIAPADAQMYMTAPAPRPQISTILVVDDDRDIRECISDILTAEGYAVVSATNGLEALAYLETEPPPAAIVLDLMMPVMDGRSFREEQRRHPELAEVPTIVITAHAAACDVMNELGVAMCLSKPLSIQTLLAALERCAPAPTAPPP